MRYFTGKLELVSNILHMIVEACTACNPQLCYSTRRVVMRKFYLQSSLYAFLWTFFHVFDENKLINQNKVTARLMSKYLWSGWKWEWRVKEMRAPPPPPPSPVICEWSCFEPLFISSMRRYWTDGRQTIYHPLDLLDICDLRINLFVDW